MLDLEQLRVVLERFKSQEGEETVTSMQQWKLQPDMSSIEREYHKVTEQIDKQSLGNKVVSRMLFLS